MELLLQHISQLETSCSELEQLAASSCDETERLQLEKEQLQTDNEQLQADNNMLIKEIKKMQAEIDRLQAENEQLQAENGQLQAENGQLQNRLKSEEQVEEQPTGQESIGLEQPSDSTVESPDSEEPSSNQKRRRSTKKKKKTDPNQMQIPFDF